KAEEAELRDKRIAALERAWSLAPDNLALTTRRLIQQAETRDRGILQTIAAAREQVQPLVEPIRQRVAGVDLNQLLDQARTAAEQGQWNQVTARLARLRNVLLPEEWWKSDNRRVHDRHLLEFVDATMRWACHGRRSPDHQASSAAPNVRLVRKEGAD